jgi:DNA-binding SARP family transcriptional activator
MVLEGGLPINTNGRELELSFELWVRTENVFGTVLRVITNNNENIDLMYRVDRDNARLPFLLTGEDVHLIETPTRKEAWLNVILSLNPRTGQVILQYDGKRIEAIRPELKGTRSVRIAFGYPPFEGFGSSDIASVNIRNVRLRRNNQEIRHWRMAQHIDDTCYDEIVGRPATGRNTQWIMNERITWRKVYSRSFNTTPAITFDPVNTNFFVAAGAKIYKISTPDNLPDFRTVMEVVREREYLTDFPNLLIYAHSLQQLIFYNLMEDAYSIFNIAQNTWERGKNLSRIYDYLNSSVVFNPKDSTLISFGGYAYYLYNNLLITGFPFHEDRPQQHVSLSVIDPRCSSATVLVGETLYIFGGRGSPTGRQELAPRNYYDLYSVDLTTKTVTPLWSLQGNPRGGHFIPGENMVYNSENQSFYVFTTQAGGVLMRINTQDAAFERMSLPIGINFAAQHIHMNLFFAPQRQKLYATVILSQIGGDSTLEIYEIDYPLTTVSSVRQIRPEIQEGGFSFNKRFRYLLGLLFLGIMSIAVFYYYRWKKQEKPQSAEEGTPDADIQVSTTALPAIFEEDIDTKFYKFSQKSICFFGGFRVFDKNGKNITALFTPTLKTLLIAFICHSTRDSKGINGNKLINLFWYDKSKESAKNNRNVYLSKLRTLLEDIGDVKLVTKHGFVKLQIEDDTLCDYLEMMNFLEENDTQNLGKMLELLTRGAMLPNVEIDWVDTFKNSFADTVIDFLSNVLKTNNLTDSIKLKIADVLFQYDFLSEEALQVKCTVFYRQGRIGLAKNVYDTFCSVFKKSLGANYQYSFMQIVEGKVKV